MTLPIPTLPRLDVGLVELARCYDVILCDVWGVVHNGLHQNRAAVDALRRFRALGGTVILITNAPAPRSQVARRLESLQVPPDTYDAIATSGDVTISMIVEAGCPPLFAIGGLWNADGVPRGEFAIYEEAARLGPREPPLVPIEKAELAICIGLDATGDAPADYDPMLRDLLRRNLPLICANPDIVVEVGEELVYCAGAIAERYTAIGGRVVQAGKPHAPIYDLAMSLAETIRGPTPRDRVLAIGDAMHTDMKGAHAQDFDALLITSGIHRGALHPEGRQTGLDQAALGRLLTDYDVRPTAAAPMLSWTL